VTDEPAAASRRESDDGLRQLAELLRAHGANAAEPEPLVALAMAAVPATGCAGLTIAGMEERWQTLAATDPVAADLSAIQFQLREGPSFDAVDSTEVVCVPDLELDLRWPAFGRHAVTAGVRSLMALRMNVEHLGRAGLVLYAPRPDAFSERDVDVAGVLAWLVGAALQRRRLRERATNLEIALETNRHIGSAIGILMARELLTAEQAFERLRETSQRLHRKLRDLAEDVINTGELPHAD
jgi:GAF domain-containing protein